MPVRRRGETLGVAVRDPTGMGGCGDDGGDARVGRGQALDGHRHGAGALVVAGVPSNADQPGGGGRFLQEERAVAGDKVERVVARPHPEDRSSLRLTQPEHGPGAVRGTERQSGGEELGPPLRVQASGLSQLAAVQGDRDEHVVPDRGEHWRAELPGGVHPGRRRRSRRVEPAGGQFDAGREHGRGGRPQRVAAEGDLVGCGEHARLGIIELAERRVDGGQPQAGVAPLPSGALGGAGRRPQHVQRLADAPAAPSEGRSGQRVRMAPPPG